MGRASGAGSPLWFRCPVQRRQRWRETDFAYPPGHEVIVRTGRTKPRRQGRAVGARNRFVAHEFRCECGHVGWSTHMDVERLPVVTS